MTQAGRLDIGGPELSALRGYAAGDHIDAIAASIDRSRDWVVGTLRSLCGLNRNRAEVVLADAARRTPGDAPPPPAMPQAPQRGEASVPASSHPFESMLARADASGVARLVRLAGRIRELVDQLHAGLAVVDAERQARERIALLEVQLTQARAALKAKKPLAARPDDRPPAARSPEPIATAAGVSARVIREWAKTQGIACQPNGPIPSGVLIAYQAGHSSEVTP